MALSERQQVLEQLRKAERPLIAFRKDWNPDSAVAASALATVLEGMGKKCEVVCDGFAPPEHLAFLPQLKRIRPEMAGLRTFVISVDTQKSRIGELSYEAKDGFLHIYLTPKSGAFDASHVKTGATDYRHDLIITLDTPDLASLGSLRADAADFFFRTPILNLDHSPANELFGQVNWVESTAASSSEVVYRLARELERPIDADLATALLTGIVAKTRSFKSGAITPQTLTAASELVAAGARRDTIVSSLYRTKTIPVLRLWGRALARLKFDPALKLVSAMLTRQDFALAGAGEAALADIVDELILSAPDAETIALISEREGGEVCCLIRSEIRRDADALSARWDGTGGRTQSRCFLKGKSPGEAEQEILSHLRAEMQKTRA
jgi:phosphoesterase RecJ-like protein